VKIVHVVPALTQEASGPSYSVRRLCDELVALRQDVALAALDWAPLTSPPKYLKTFQFGFGPARLGRSPTLRRWLRDAAASDGRVVLHNHGMWQLNSVYPAWAVRGTNTHLVYSPRGALSVWAMQHGSRLKKFFWTLLQNPALKRASCFHATAESEYTDIRRLGFRQPVAIIPNGIDIPTQPPRVVAAQRTLLFLARIHAIKGLDLLLEAWRDVQDRFPAWRLVIAGSDDGYHGSSGYLAEIKVLARQFDLKRIEFAGPLYGQVKQQAFGDAELYILPSRSENFAMTVAESLAMGTPVVVSKEAPWSALARKGAGWWVDLGADSLTACLEQALACSPSELTAMGERGRAWMAQDFSWSQVAAKMLSTYEWLDDRTRPVPDWIRLD
jgi:glycosyltransferase involved in cell wall biosynthesis